MLTDRYLNCANDIYQSYVSINELLDDIYPYDPWYFLLQRHGPLPVPPASRHWGNTLQSVCESGPWAAGVEVPGPWLINLSAGFGWGWGMVGLWLQAMCGELRWTMVGRFLYHDFLVTMVKCSMMGQILRIVRSDDFDGRSFIIKVRFHMSQCLRGVQVVCFPMVS